MYKSPSVLHTYSKAAAKRSRTRAATTATATTITDTATTATTATATTVTTATTTTSTTTNQMEFTTSGELINVKPNWIINTSCEHMDSSWFETADSSQLIIMQTNNSPDFEGHINTCESVEEMKEKYPLDKILYIGELSTPAYTRFMQIGFKK